MRESLLLVIKPLQVPSTFSGEAIGMASRAHRVPMGHGDGRTPRSGSLPGSDNPADPDSQH